MMYAINQCFSICRIANTINPNETATNDRILRVSFGGLKIADRKYSVTHKEEIGTTSMLYELPGEKCKMILRRDERRWMAENDYLCNSKTKNGGTESEGHICPLANAECYQQPKEKEMNEILHGTKNLLFDLGGVIIDLKRERAVEAFIAIGCPGIAELLDNSHQQGAFLALEEGRMTAPEFRDEVRRMAGREISDNAIDTALNRFLVGIPTKKLKMLRMLRKQYRVMMLSNTNPIMFDTEIARLFRSEGGEMGDYFDDVFTSYKLGITKPARRCFELVIAQSGIVPGETLFLDDSQKNLDAAAALGFKTYLAKPYEDYSPMFGLEL